MIKVFEKRKTSDSESIMSLKNEELSNSKKTILNDFMTHFLFNEKIQNSEIKKNVKVMNIKKQVEYEKNRNFFNLQNKKKNFSPKKSNINFLEENLEKEKKIVIKLTKKKSDGCKNLIKLLKNFFYHGNLENEKKIKNLNEKEKKFLTEILFLDQEFVLKNDYILHKKIQRGLKNILKNYISKFYNGKKLNFIRKLFKKILKKIKEKKNLEYEKKKIKMKKKNLLNEYFNFPKNDIMNMIRLSIKEFKKRDTLLCFSFPLFKKEFDFQLDLLMKEKWQNFKNILILKFEKKYHFGIQENFLFREALENLCVFSSGYVYIKKIYSCLD